MSIEVASVIDGRGSRTLAVGLSNQIYLPAIDTIVTGMPMATTMTRLPPISLQNLNPHVMLMPRLKAVSYLIKSTIGVPTLVPCTTPVPTAFVVLPTMLT